MKRTRVKLPKPLITLIEQTDPVQLLKIMARIFKKK
jgi:hypothetical protein